MAKKYQDLSAEEKGVLKKMYLWSHSVFWGFTMTKMEANGFTLTLSPAIESIYKDDLDEKREAYRRHQNFFNTHAVPFAFIASLAYAMENEHKKNGLPAQTIEDVKAALMGPTAGMFDSIFFNCLRIIAAGIGIGLANQGNFLGVIMFIILYLVPQEIVRFLFIRYGYILGTEFIDQVFQSGLMNSLTKAASVMGLMMIGAMTATMVSVPLNWEINIGGAITNIGDTLNSIFPNLLGPILLFFLVSQIRKGRRPTHLVLGMLVFGIVGALLHIF